MYIIAHTSYSHTQVPLEDDVHPCVLCDKFVGADGFEKDQLALGPGKMICGGCAEFADMF